MRIRCVVNKILIFVITAISLLAFSSCQKANGTSFSFSSYKTADKVAYNVIFDENYFENPASSYNPKLASASACLALSGFSAVANTDFEKSDTNAKDFFMALGFGDYSANKYGVTKPEASSFGVYIASKKINDYTLLGITVRGAGYLTEWASNFKIGKNEDFAEGFLEASDIYLDFLREYVEKYNISGHIKIWTAGYSRGGATVNLACGRIDDGLKNGINIISDRVNYNKDDIYAFCFEAPAGKIIRTDDEQIIEKGIDYSNIFSILNLNDPVPFVAPRNFNFIRYGNDLFLPDIITDINYSKHIDLVKRRMTKLPNYRIIGDYKIDQFSDESKIGFLNKGESPYINATPHLYLNDLFDAICEIVGSKDNYVDKLQPSVTELFKFIYSNLSAKESAINFIINIGKYVLLDDSDSVIFYDLQNNVDKLFIDLEPLVVRAFRRADVNMSITDIRALLKEILNLAKSLLFRAGGIDLIKPMLNFDNVSILGSAHIPELLLTHITSLDDNYESSGLSVKDSYNVLYVNTNNEFEIVSNNDKYVYFENGKINSKLAIKKLENEYIIYMPNDLDFVINSNYDLSYELYNHNNKYLNEQKIKGGAISGK